MEIFELMAERKHEQLAFWNEPMCGYKGIIAIHDTTMGPALGGTRFWNYQSESEAVVAPETGVAPLYHSYSSAPMPP